MDAEELAASWRDGALVYVGSEASQIVRPAAFVFVDLQGLTWVEPAYVDPTGAASHALHRRPGEAVVVHDWIEVHGGSEPLMVLPFVPEIHEEDDGGALIWFSRHLAESHTDWQFERARVWRMIS